MAMLFSPLLCGAFNLSNTLGDGMVLQRTQAATVWGFGDPGVTVTTTFLGSTLQTTVGQDGVWRQALPPQKATATPTTLSFAGSDGGTAQLRDVLFGDVYLCGGQSNMQYTPRSMDGMNNMSAEIAAADHYPHIRLFTVGQYNSSRAPWSDLGAIEQPWSVASSRTVAGANSTEGVSPLGRGWNFFSSVW